MPKIKIIGTSHIAPESAEKVKRAITEIKPDIVAIELDHKRFAALLSEKKHSPSLSDIRRVGFGGWLFLMLGSWAERKLGNKTGMAPGTEMIIAAKAAHHVSAKLALIDQDIEITLRNFSRALTFREKFRFVIDLFKGLIFRKGITFDLSKVPPQEVITKLISEVKDRYPNIYRVLVADRNEYMADKLALLARTHPDSTIIAVVGAGHQKEIAHLLQTYLKTTHDTPSKRE